MVGLIDCSLLPVQLLHDFCHFSDISAVTRGSSSEAGDFNAVTVRERPCFAAESAFSFPGMPLAHCSDAADQPTQQVLLAGRVGGAVQVPPLRSITDFEHVFSNWLRRW